jgi:hypothetical protein
MKMISFLLLALTLALQPAEAQITRAEIDK